MLGKIPLQRFRVSGFRAFLTSSGPPARSASCVCSCRGQRLSGLSVESHTCNHRTCNSSNIRKNTIAKEHA